MGNRRMGVLVTPEAIFGLLHDWQKCVVDSEEPHKLYLPDLSGIPGGARLVSVEWLPLKQLLMLVLEHETFPQVESGHDIPIYDGRVEYVGVQIAMGAPHVESKG